MLYRLGRALQVVGMLILPVAIAGNLAGEPPPLNLWASLKLSGVGVVVFIIGYGIQQLGKQQK
jgi:hypothetical protein